MSTLNKSYRYYLTIPAQGEVEVFPCNDRSTIEWKKDEKLKYHKKEFTDILIFGNEGSHNTFDALYAMQKNCLGCYTIPLRVEKMACDGSGFVDYWEGYLPYHFGQWDLYKCQLSIKPRTIDKLDCIRDIWSKEINILDCVPVEDRITIDSLIGEVECQFRTGATVTNSTPPIPPPPTGYGWQVQIKELEEIDPDGSGDTLLSTCYIRYCRECLLTTPPPGSPGWQQDSTTGNWYRPLALANGVISTNFSTGSQDPNDPDFSLTLQQFTTYSPIDIEIDNGISQEQMFNAFFKDCDLTVCSDFFGIGPPSGNAPDNNAYNCAAEDLHNLVYAQLSDVVIASGLDGTGPNDRNATVLNKDFKGYWQDLCKQFPIKMFYDEVVQCVRVEHVSYEVKGKVWNLTSNKKYAECLREWSSFEYQEIDYPAKESWRYPTETDLCFYEGFINYDDRCSDRDFNTREKEYDLKCTEADLEYFHDNPDLQSKGDTNGLFVFALDPVGGITIRPCCFTGVNVANGALAMPYLVKKYWTYDRPQKFGDVNGLGSIQFDTIKYTKKQTINLDCVPCNVLVEYDPNFIRIQANYGYAQVESIKFVDHCVSGAVTAEIQLTYRC